ncbi:MAG: metal-dependent transcriptional regulator [Clostridia bacterium]|nr:metal-dependent transcriptional regulator [Clostridia bacterium]
MAVTEAVENYLETIYILSLKKSEVHAIDICNHLGYSRPTVSIVLKQLRDKEYVIVNEDNHIFLTKSGEKIAKRIYERHVILTKMLTSIGVPADLAQEDACKIEHDLSDETFRCIKRHYKEEHQGQQSNKEREAKA